MLLLLDNLEQVIEAAPELVGAPLRLPQPHPPRHLPRAPARLRARSSTRCPRSPSPRRSRSSASAPSSSPPPRSPSSARRLDSLPLAVELAAARTKALSPAQILERLSQRLDLLKGGRDADPRQQTLRATIEWSYELLAPEEQAALRPPLRLRRRLHARGRRGGVRRRPRHPAVARREEPPALHDHRGRLALLDARDDPGVRGRAA